MIAVSQSPFYLASGIDRGLDPFPSRALRRLKYCLPLSLASDGFTAFKAGTALGFNLNSLFAPSTAGGHQPYGHDSLALLYRRYRVNHVQVRVTQLSSKVTSYPDGLVVQFSPPGGSDGLSAVNFNVYAEKPGNYVLPGSVQPVTRVFSYNMWDIAQISKQEFDANIEEFAALFGASPTRIPLMYIASWSPDVTPPTIYAMIELEYTCEVWERIILAQS